MAKKAKKTVKSKAVKKSPAKKTNQATVKKSAKKSAKKPVKKASSKKKKDDLMCFLTSACVNFYGLKDNGYELNTLRQYRDSYLTRSKEGRELIQTYYQVSPVLVELINKDEARSDRYTYIYSQVQGACAAIEKKHFLKAKTIYKDMVNTLIENYSHG